MDGLVLFCLLMAAIVAIVAGSKGRSVLAWGLYGVLVWPIALVHVLLLPKTAERQRIDMIDEGRRPCPHCAEYIMAAAVVCPHCRSELGADWSARERGRV